MRINKTTARIARAALSGRSFLALAGLSGVAVIEIDYIT